jgi:hypothetical protein
MVLRSLHCAAAPPHPQSYSLGVATLHFEIAVGLSTSYATSGGAIQAANESITVTLGSPRTRPEESAMKLQPLAWQPAAPAHLWHVHSLVRHNASARLHVTLSSG